MPIARGIPQEEDSESNEESSENKKEYSIVPTESAKEVLNGVLRSKGFVWCADSNSNSMYWSHAGTSFEYKCLGRWWATLPRDQWPEGVDEYVLRDFDDINHPSEGGEDFGINGDRPTSVGDRRQEVVFIGLGFGQLSKQIEIRETLDQCLLSDQEYNEYRSICLDKTKSTEDPDGLLQQTFPTAMASEYVNY